MSSNAYHFERFELCIDPKSRGIISSQMLQSAALHQLLSPFFFRRIEIPSVIKPLPRISAYQAVGPSIGRLVPSPAAHPIEKGIEMGIKNGIHILEKAALHSNINVP